MTDLSTCISFLILLGYKVSVVKALTQQISKGEEYEKILSVILACCTILGFSLNNMTSVYANVNALHTTEVRFEEEGYYKFTQKELKNTEYSGHTIEVINSEVYVDGRSIVAIVVYLYTVSGWIIVGYMANGTFQAIVDFNTDVFEAKTYAIDAWNTYRNTVKSVYANTKSHTATVYLSNGSVCYRQSANTYACSYDIEPDKPVVD
jgi:phosphoribosyl-AMP cyclohydrolase